MTSHKITKGNNPPLVPLVINENGGSSNITFEFMEKTAVYWSCSTVWNNQMLVFGGIDDKYQISLGFHVTMI